MNLCSLKKFSACFCLLAFSSAVSAKIVERIAAVVDDQMISLSQMQSYKKLISSGVPYSSRLFEIRSKSNIIKSKKKLLDHLIDEAVLRNAFPEAQFKKPDPDRIFRDMLKSSRLSKKRLFRKLKKLRISLEKYKEMIALNQAYEMWINSEVAGAVSITNQDIDDYYLEKTGRHFFKNYKYELNQWKFELSQAGRSEAEKFLKGAKQKKPTVQTLTKDQMNAELKGVVLKLVPGQFSKPVCFAHYCYVFKLAAKYFLVVDKNKTENIRAKLFNRAFASQLKIWMQKKRRSSIIKKYI